MKRSSPISNALHVLVHLVQANGTPITSDELARCLRTNPVVVRRNMAVLRAAGIVASAPGHGGGWTLTRPPADISLHAVYAALGERLVALPQPDPEHPVCLLEARVHAGLGDVFLEIETLLADRLARLSLADLARDVPLHGCPPATATTTTTEEIPHVL